MSGAGTPPVAHVAHPRVRHLELWDALVRGRPLFDQRDAPTYPELVAEVTLQAAARHRASRVFLAGGDPRLRDVERLLRRSGSTSIQIADDPVFVAEPAARELLAPHARTLAIDAGQTSLKIFTRGTRLRVARPAGCVGADAFLAWLGEIVRAQGPLDAWLVGLPCEIDGAHGRACSYFDALDLADLAALCQAPLAVTSDAELAAHSAILGWSTRDEPPSGLVLTLGHGLGAALVLPP